MSALAVALILASAVMHALWNVFVKTGDDRLSTMALVMAGLACGAPWLIVAAPAPDPASWPYIAASVVINNVYFFLLIEAYRRGDFSHAYPIARGTAPLAVAIGATVFAGESLRPIELLGVGLVSVSIASLVWTGRHRQATAALGGRALRGNIFFPLATGLMVAAFTVVDGIGVRLSGSPFGYIGWLFLFACQPILLYACAVRRGALVTYVRWRWKALIVAGALGFGSYGCAILALNLGAMASVAALRETSVIFAALIGTRMLGEPFGRGRLGAALGVALGAVLIQAGAL